MSRSSVVFGNKVVADKFRADLDAELGFPRPNIMGPGASVASATETYAFLLKHPSQNKWAYPDDPVIRGKRGRVALPAGGTQEDIDSDPTWAGATVVSFRKEELE